MEWIDNIGQTIKVGHYIFAMNGKFTIERVNRLSMRDDGVFDPEPTVVFDDGRYMYASYVISLTALGCTSDMIASEKSGKTGYDILGHELHDGDVVLSVPGRMQTRVQKGIVLKLNAATCKISKGMDINNTEFHRRKYVEVLSLSALGKENIEIQTTEY